MTVIWLRAVLEPLREPRPPQLPEIEFPTAIPVEGAVWVIYADGEIRVTPDEARERGFVEAAERAQELARERGEMRSAKAGLFFVP